MFRYIRRVDKSKFGVLNSETLKLLHGFDESRIDLDKKYLPHTKSETVDHRETLRRSIGIKKTLPLLDYCGDNNADGKCEYHRSCSSFHSKLRRRFLF